MTTKARPNPFRGQGEKYHLDLGGGNPDLYCLFCTVCFCTGETQLEFVNPEKDASKPTEVANPVKHMLAN